MTINTGNGDDLIAIMHNMVAEGINLNTGSGFDYFQIVDTIVGKLNANLGSGDDSFSTFLCIFAPGSKVNGGGGKDLFVHGGTPNSASVTLKSVETQQEDFPTELLPYIVDEFETCRIRLGGDSVFND